MKSLAINACHVSIFDIDFQNMITLYIDLKVMVTCVYYMHMSALPQIYADFER